MSNIKSKSISSSQTSGIESLVNKIPKGDSALLFDKINYILMAVGLVLIAVGFMLMAGGADVDPNVFDPNEVYSSRRITVAPIVVLLGFIVEIVAVLKKPSLQQ